jgi:hypothetical protein
MTKILPRIENSFLELIETIESHFPLSYTDEINQLFVEFTKRLDGLTSYDNSLAKRLNRL